MWREYASKPTDLPTDDLLEAVKMSINCEADFYIYGRMIASWMGLSMEENIRRLDKEGIETYVVDGDYRFRYKDPEKNIKRIFFEFINIGEGKGEVHLNSYRSRKDQPFYSSIEEIYELLKEDCPHVHTLNVVDFSGDKYEGSYQYNLQNHVKNKLSENC
ncbi:hypothetical protein bthur0014_58730 [Bacillus thuringiensis IBL 4222]|nr:hypothetical protein bthur0014_58730 [Bacillus thuringiensis IBL 4222]